MALGRSPGGGAPWLVLALALLLFTQPAFAVLPDEMLKDPAMEARARTLSQELRCLVCQNQTIDDSNAPLARDLRLLVRERLKAGDGDQAVLAYVTARYGDFVLMRPPFQANTLVLWLAPFVVLLLGAAGTALWLRGRRSATGEPPPLSPDEQRRLAKLLGGDGTP
ncbi:MAG: cytochrome c-type biogenesis protein CcmH [Azospirillum sp.]|nr:cytochrome c-type biogenesis protein CcmH [Azospirillum sp.]